MLHLGLLAHLVRFPSRPIMARESLFLRFASPGERRLIFREDLGFYRSIVVGAVYDFAPGDQADLTLVLPTFVNALRCCVEKLPYLSVVAGGIASEKPFFERVPKIDINDHLSIIDANKSRDDEQWLEVLLESMLDRPNPQSVPPWRVTICPIAAQKYYVLFAYSHVIGDGLSGPVFHRTFLDALQSTDETEVESTTELLIPQFSLPEPFDIPERLPISWSFLLGPLMAALLPTPVVKWLGIRAHTTNANEGTWTGSNVFFEPETYRTRLKILTISNDQLRNAIMACRAHDAKLTATIHQLIVRALSKCITDDKATNFVSQTAISMRTSIGASNEVWGNFASGHYGVHPRMDDQSPSPDHMWESAAFMSNDMAVSTTRLNDQPLGLLRYAPNIRTWLQKKLGGRRDCSYELSNSMSFDAGEQVRHRCRINKMMVAQPGNVVGAPINFNLLSVTGGPLVCTITWQQGALGVPLESEDALVNSIRSSLQEELAGIGRQSEKA
ncbi:alcohol acetyltransferase [Paramyrothecium foliicola]|nr:alcohol acetyltransferase [Paramyrothecium foliicola]